MATKPAFPLISVIVPAYNLENRIARTLLSLLKQDYPALEIIVVDDCSPDNTASAARDVLEGGGTGFKIIRHDTNLGVSAARNTGMAASSGEFILFMDGDDYADSDFILALYNAMRSSDECDISFCGYRVRVEETGNESYRRIPRRLVKYGGRPPYLAALRLLKKFAPNICTVLFRSDFIASRRLLFEQGCSAGEDIEFFVKALVQSRRAGISTRCPYVYLIHKGMGSVAQSTTEMQRLTRYAHNTEAHARLASYLDRYASEPLLVSLSKYMLRPQVCQRRLSLLASSNDRSSFDAMLSDERVRRTLLSSCRSFCRKPEVFLKSLLLLIAPGVYFDKYKPRKRCR